MSNGKRCWTIALVIPLCVMAVAGCRNKRSRHVTVNNSGGIFTTDDFPGAPVQDGNVADDKRAFNAGDYTGQIFCTQNGDRGTMMVSYRESRTVYSHYYDGERWTPGVALRNSDADMDGTLSQVPVVHAFLNTANDGREAAQERDGDCVILWTAYDADSDGMGPDSGNQVLYVSTFDSTFADDPSMNYGFDVNPSTPGVFEARRLSSPDRMNENLQVVGVVTDGLCGEARWSLAGTHYRYGDDTTGLVAFWHQKEEKFVGTYDDTTAVAIFDLGAPGDPAMPLPFSPSTQLDPMLFGASDAGMNCRETVVGMEYVSYNGVLFRRVRAADMELPNGTSGWLDLDFDMQLPISAGEDISLQATHFDMVTGSSSTRCLNTVVPDSSPGNVDDIGSDFLRPDGLVDGFVSHAGQGVLGRDEGISCLVTFFGEVATADYTVAVPWNDEGAEGGICMAEMDEATGTLISSTRVSSNNPGLLDNCMPSETLSTRISRNGDYVWIAWYQADMQGGTLDSELYAAQYRTTRLDDDGNPQPVAPIASSLGSPLSLSDGVVDPYGFAAPLWYQWQDNLGYTCGIQSDAAVMNIFFYTPSASGDQIYHVRLTADTDGTPGGESASAPALVVTDSATFLHAEALQFFVNDHRSTFNATDAGSDGDVLCAYVRDGDGVDGPDEQYLFAQRVGLTSGAAVEIGSRTGKRQVSRSGRIRLVATPPGETLGAWDEDEGAYEVGAHHGAEFIHVLFHESETGAITDLPGSLGSSLSGFALRTRTYRCEGAGSSVGEDFTPSAGASFSVPFDIDLPFVDPESTDQCTVFHVGRCGNSVAIVFQELGHLYYQECNPEDGDENLTGWRQGSPGVSDPALVDDDMTEPVYGTELVAPPHGACCDIDGTAIFWNKEMSMDDSITLNRLQVRIIDRDR